MSTFKDDNRPYCPAHLQSQFRCILSSVDARAERSLKDLIAGFCGADAQVAEACFPALCEITSRGLKAYLKSKLYSDEAREDVIQEVLKRLWMRRGKWEDKGASGWWALVKRIADQCRIDMVRKVGGEVLWDDAEVGEVEDGESTTVELLLEAIADREALYRAADELWLGFSELISDRDRVRRALAAQLFYQHALGWEEVLTMLNRNSPDRPLSRGELDSWLADPSVIRSAAFRTLFRSNDQLASHLLEMDPIDEAALNALTVLAMAPNPKVAPPGNWTWPEVQVILWRYRQAERVDKIQAHELCSVEKDEMAALFDRCLAKFPFSDIMKQLLDSLERWPLATRELSEPGLWQRLVFEYYCRETSNHRDIFDRTSSPADLASYRLTMAMLNVWLSNGRLFARLAAHLQQAGGEA